MKNRKTGKENVLANGAAAPVGMGTSGTAAAIPEPDGQAAAAASVPEPQGLAASPAVQQLLDELTDTGADSVSGAQEGTGEDPVAQAEDELVKTARSERSRERIRSIIAARREAETRAAQYEAIINRFRQVLHGTGMDMEDIAATLHYGKLVASGDPHLMHHALDILNRERENLCRRLGVAEPGVDLFADVPEIRDALERRELRLEHALRLANVERAERAAHEKYREEAERGKHIVELFSDLAEFMKTMGTCLQPYASEADHPAKMQRIFDYMLSPGWANDFVAHVPRPMWAKHVKYLYDSLGVPALKPAISPQPLRSFPRAAGQVADNQGISNAERIMRRMDEMGL